MAKRKKRVKKKTAGKVTAKRGGRPARAQGAAGAIQGALQHVTAAVDHLLAERARIDEQINNLQQTLGQMGSAPRAVAAASAAAAGPGRGRRGPRSGSLKEYIERVLGAGGGVMAVKDIADGVVSAGYETKNQTLAKSVGIALTQMSNVQKVGRGQFKLK